MKFDSQPDDLRNPKAESIATFLDLRKTPTPAQRDRRDDHSKPTPGDRAKLGNCLKCCA